MTALLFADLETYSTVPIAHGAHRYAEGAKIMLWPYAIGDGPSKVWDVTTGDPMPDDLAQSMDDQKCLTVWHNGGMFDTVVLKAAMGIDLPLPRVHDTMVQALSHSLPGALGVLCEVLNVATDKAKDKAGKQLIQLFCKPRPPASKITRATRHTHPVEWARFVEYARLDVEAMREVYKKLPTWNYKGTEMELWHLDQRINRRGMCVDVELARAAVLAVEKAQKELASRTVEMTDGQVASTTQRDALLLHVLEAYGVDLPDLQMATLERRMSDPDLPPALKELLGVRLQASTSSTSKYKALMNSVSSDGRLRGTKQFNGAARTGRWAGRLFQPDNLPRPVLKQRQIELGIDALKAGCADLIVDNVMELTSSAIRSCIVAPPGKKLVVADLANIEGRDQAWLAGEAWKLQAFRDYDEGNGPDLYKLAYAKSFGGSPDTVTKDQRQIGKVQELMLGYEGGVGAFITGAATYRFDIEELARQVLPIAPGWALNEASGFYDWTVKQGRNTFSLSRDAFVASDTVKRVWRNLHPAIASYWPELRDAAIAAIEQPGTTLASRRLKIRRDGSWLRIGLPSGRALCYPSPQVVDGAITYMGLNQYSRKWCRLKSYGGKLFENICQAVARDVMTANMPLIEAAGYAIVLTVHDEVICEAPDTDDFNATHLASLLAANPPWAPDMPLAAAGFETDRYRKD